MNQVLRFFSENPNLGPMGIVVMLLTFFILFVAPFIFKVTLRSAPSSFWQSCFLEFNTPVSDYYSTISNTIKYQKIPRLRSTKVILKPEGGFFSPRRKYLRVKRKQHAIYIGATPFGSSYVFSWHIFPRISLFRFLVYNIPIVGKLLLNRSHGNTFYRKDTDYAFYSIIHRIVLDQVEEVTKDKRTLSPDEKNPVMADIFKR